MIVRSGRAKEVFAMLSVGIASACSEDLSSEKGGRERGRGERGEGNGAVQGCL
jgi:hypothetical protein